MSIGKILRDMHTVANGTDYDWGRVWGSIGALLFVAISVHRYIVRDDAWDPFAWSGALGAVLVGTGLTLLAKRDTEPR